MPSPTVYAWTKPALDVKTDQGNAGDIDVRDLTGIAIDCVLTSMTGGTTPSVQFIVDRKNIDGTYTQIVAGVALTAAGTTSFSIGPGLTTATITGVIIRIRWTVVGAPTTAVANIYVQGETEY